jgi:TPR repeat protein
VARDDSAFTAAERRNALQALRVLGHWRGPVDGQPFGQAVRTAIRHWQGFEALPETGTLDDRGLARLVEAQEVLAALLERPARSPAGVAASSVAGGADRYARGWAAERGAGVPANPAEAAYWYGLAAQEGEVRAFVQLGLLLARGLGVGAADPAEAAAVWRVAAALGDPTAAFNLGTLRERGMGWPANREAAIFWYTLAAPQNAAAAQGLRRLGR